MRSGVDCAGLRGPAPGPGPTSPAACLGQGLRSSELDGGAMYRLLSAVTARAAATWDRAWDWGRRGTHGRAGLPPIGPGWAAGLGLGMGLVLGANLVGGLRSAAPAQTPADPEESGQVEPAAEQVLGPGSPHSPTPPNCRGFSRAIESSRDLLRRIKVRRRGPHSPGSPQNPAEYWSPRLCGPHPGGSWRLPRTSGFPTARQQADALGVAQVRAEVTDRGGDLLFPAGELARRALPPVTACEAKRGGWAWPVRVGVSLFEWAWS